MFKNFPGGQLSQEDDRRNSENFPIWQLTQSGLSNTDDFPAGHSLQAATGSPVVELTSTVPGGHSEQDSAPALEKDRGGQIAQAEKSSEGAFGKQHLLQ